MNTKIILLITVFLFSSMALLSEEQKKSKLDNLEYSIGLNLSYNEIPILVGEKPAAGTQPTNTLKLSYLALNFDATLSEYLTVGAIAGYNTKSLKNDVDFVNLPLSLRLSGNNFNSFVLGLKAKSDFFSWKDFEIGANAEFLYFMNSSKQLSVTLPIVSGTSTFKNKLTLELLIQYEGFSNFNLYAGPQLNMVKGKFAASETIEALTGSEELTYKQKHTFGLVGGISFETGNIDINARITLISKTSASILFSYVF